VDPNELLLRLLTNCKAMRVTLDRTDDPVAEFERQMENGIVEDVDQIVEDVLNLTTWLSNGGFAPDWAAHHDTLPPAAERDDVY